MWVLIQEPKGGGPIEGFESGIASWCLVSGNVYTVGRTAESTIQSPGDTSISKQHAKLVVNPSPSAKAGERPEVLLEDLGSKFGTHLNAGIMSESQRLVTDANGVLSRALTKPVRLKDNDRLRFGVMFSIYRLRWLSLQVTSSMLKSKRELEGWLGQLEPGCKVQGAWCRETTHLVMPSISLSAKAVNSLVVGVPIVTPEFFRDFLSAVTSCQKLPASSHSIPSVSATDTESQLRDPVIDFQVNPGRREVFKGKTFLFFSDKQLKVNVTPIELGGGSSVLCLAAPQLSLLTQPGHIAVQPPGHAALATPAPTLSSGSQATQPPPLWVKAVSILSAAGLISIPQTSIYLAIVHCSTAVHCNPSRRPISLLHQSHNSTSSQPQQPHRVLAGDTEEMESQTQPIVDPTSETQVSNSTQASKADSQRGLKRTVSPDGESPSVASSNAITPVEADKPASKRIKLEEQVNSSTMTLPVERNDSDKENRETNIIEDGVGSISSKSVFKSQEVQGFNSHATDKIESQVRKRGLSSEERETTTQPVTQKRRVISPTPASDEDDIFGFGNSPVKKDEAPKSSLLSKPVKPKSDEIFAFEDSDDDEELATLTSLKKPDSIPSITSTVSVIGPSGDHDKSLKSKTNVNPEPKLLPLQCPSKEMIQKPVLKSSNKTLDSTGFVGKGDVTMKSEYEEELSKSICKLLTVSMMRKDATLPRYVPAAEPSLLGKPTVNFKKFKKTPVVTARRKATLGPYVGPGEVTMNPRITEWLSQHQDVTRLEVEGEERVKEKEQFWDFLESQNGPKKSSQRTLTGLSRRK